MGISPHPPCRAPPILATLTPQAIAVAIPPTTAEQVAEELAARLAA